MNELKDKLAEWFRRDLDELKQNKIRVIAVVVCLVMLIAFKLTDDGSDVEKIDLDAPPATKDLPVQQLPAKISPMPEAPDGLKIVLGATNDEIFVGDPFAVPPKPKVEPPKVEPPKVELPQIQLQPIQPPQPSAPKEKIVLTGTAISGTNKTAMFLRDKKNVFLYVGDEIGGRIIADITPDFVIFTDGKRLYLQKELN